MRYRQIIMLLALAGTLHVNAQSDDAGCPGFRNTANFSTGNPLFFWSARVGERVLPSGNNDTTTGYYVMSTCAASNAQVVAASSITSASYNSGADGGITCCNDGNLWDANDHRFQIITSANAGADQFTINGENSMQRICPGYSTSIRLGDPRATGNASSSHNWASGSNKGSEALFYTMQVNPLNALLIINYAVVGRCYPHTAREAGEFLIRVVKQNADGTWPNAPINDSLWFKVSAPDLPSNNQPVAPWVMGRPGSSCSSTTCGYVYKPWAKAAISLSNYMYENVRVEMYTSDCIYNVDPLYAYIAGDFAPMQINAVGCADANSSAIDTLSAPEGMITYQWFVCTTGYDDDIYNAEHMDSLNYRQLSEPSESNLYVPTIEDFVVTEGPNTGDTIPQQTFLCKMVSALDPAKPFTSKVYANVENGKPTPYAAISSDCDLTIHFTNASVTYGNNTIDADSTYWVIYSDTLNSSVLDTVWGESVSYQFPAQAYYNVKMRVRVRGKNCGSERTFVVEAIESLPDPIRLSEAIVCDGDTVQASCTSHCERDKEWHIGEAVYISDSVNHYDTITWVPAVGNTTVSLTTSYKGRCQATTTALVKCEGYTEITSNVDASLICAGDTVMLSAAGIDSPHWSSVPYDPILDSMQGEDTVYIHPMVTTTYTVRPAGETRCLMELPEITIKVLAYPIPTIWSSRPCVERTDPKVTFEDRSPNSTSSVWTFSDGLTETGVHVEHQFGAMGDSVTVSLHACNDNRCCSDTTIVLPVEVNALWVPNAFTPSENTNSRFMLITTISITDFEIWIYNRQGLLVHHGTDISEGWDGNDLDGAACQQGAYVYFYRYTKLSEPDRRYTGEGTVTLIR